MGEDGSKLAKIGLIAAMPQESQALLRQLEQWEPSKLGPFRSFSFQLYGRPCLLVQSGIGLERASEAARLLIQDTSLELLVSFGIAGAVGDDLDIGDVVIASQSCLLEQGIPGHCLPLAASSEATWHAVKQALQPRGARLVSGTALTTRGSQLVIPETQELPNPILEMETSGIAQVAVQAGIPLLALRAISDGPLAPIPLDLAEVYDEDYHLRVGKLIRAVLRQPGIILQGRMVTRNVSTAAGNVAIAVKAAIAAFAALSQPLPLALQAS